MENEDGGINGGSYGGRRRDDIRDENWNEGRGLHGRAGARNKKGKDEGGGAKRRGADACE